MHIDFHSLIALQDMLIIPSVALSDCVLHLYDCRGLRLGWFTPGQNNVFFFFLNFTSCDGYSVQTENSRKKPEGRRTLIITGRVCIDFFCDLRSADADRRFLLARPPGVNQMLGHVGYYVVFGVFGFRRSPR